jgi:hypothetical protein
MAAAGAGAVALWITFGVLMADVNEPNPPGEDQEEPEAAMVGTGVGAGVCSALLLYILVALPFEADPVPGWEYGFNAGPEGGSLSLSGRF